jgi:hypothetical protein
MDAKTLTFENLVYKKTPEEQAEAEAEGYREIYREAVPGGHKITYAKMQTVFNGQKRVTVFVLPEMPPEHLINKEVTVQKVRFTRPATVSSGEQVIEGSYGLVSGRKFLVVGEPATPAGRPKKQPS